MSFLKLNHGLHATTLGSLGSGASLNTLFGVDGGLGFGFIFTSKQPNC